MSSLFQTFCSHLVRVSLITIVTFNLTSTAFAVPWKSFDNPDLLNNRKVNLIDFDNVVDTLPLDYNFSNLPLYGTVKVNPWVGSYWPKYTDSINYKWDGPNSKAATTKYAEAFNKENVEDLISQKLGIKSRINSYGSIKCKTNSDCGDSEYACSKEEGKEVGVCIETWAGICHAWASAAVLVPEPKRAVIYNGVVFKVNDIKALVTASFDQGKLASYIGATCRKSDNGRIKYDKYGRPSENDFECADTNAGSFHVAVANFIGKQKVALVEDRTYDAQIWNQPIRSYEVLESVTVSAQKANELIGAKGDVIEEKELSLKVKSGEFKFFKPFSVKEGHSVVVTMSGTKDADLIVDYKDFRKYSSEEVLCMPYLEGSYESCEFKVPNGVNQFFMGVQGAIGNADIFISVKVREEAPITYLFNDKATKFQYIRMNLSYVAESDIKTDGNLSAFIDEYTHTDSYEYILEMNEYDEIIGGEWVGPSKRNHPDYLRLPYAKRSSKYMGVIDWEDINMLLKLSVE